MDRRQGEPWWPDEPRELRTVTTQVTKNQTDVELHGIDWRMATPSGSPSEDANRNQAIVIQEGAKRVHITGTVEHAEASSGYPTTDGVLHATGINLSSAVTQPAIEDVRLSLHVKGIRGDAMQIKHTIGFELYQSIFEHVYRTPSALLGYSDHPDVIQGWDGLKNWQIRETIIRRCGAQGLFLQEYPEDGLVEDVLVYGLIDREGVGWKAASFAPKRLVIRNATLLGSVFINLGAEQVVIQDSVIGKLNLSCDATQITIERSLVREYALTGAAKAYQVDPATKGQPTFRGGAVPNQDWTVTDHEIVGGPLTDIGVRVEALPTAHG